MGVGGNPLDDILTMDGGGGTASALPHLAIIKFASLTLGAEV